jgi:hypothetical protein
MQQQPAEAFLRTRLLLPSSLPMVRVEAKALARLSMSFTSERQGQPSFALKRTHIPISKRREPQATANATATGLGRSWLS